MAEDTTLRSQCVLAADASASPTLIQKLGVAEVKRIVERCHHRIERVVVAHRGVLFNTDGVGALAVFNTADEGRLAACDMQQKIDDLPPASGYKLAIRVGLDFGDIVEQGASASGKAVTTARRLSQLALPGQVIVSESFAKQLPQQRHTAMRPLASDDPAAPPLWQMIWREDATNNQLGRRLQLRHGEKHLFVSNKRNGITLGRDPQSDIVTRDPCASRHHASIELRDDKFVLIDKSTNGSVVSTAAAGDKIVKQQEAELSGSGCISFRRANKESGASDFIDYTVIDDA